MPGAYSLMVSTMRILGSSDIFPVKEVGASSSSLVARTALQCKQQQRTRIRACGERIEVLDLLAAQAEAVLQRVGKGCLRRPQLNI